MGERVASGAAREAAALDPLIIEFARLLNSRYGARVFLFGSRARGSARPDSDYDVVAVGPAFEEQPILSRARDRRILWRQAGGWGIGLDLHCYTPAEFRRQINGLGYLHTAKQRGELIEVKV